MLPSDPQILPLDNLRLDRDLFQSGSFGLQHGDRRSHVVVWFGDMVMRWCGDVMMVVILMVVIVVIHFLHFLKIRKAEFNFLW